jgi:hypothetical protein
MTNPQNFLIRLFGLDPPGSKSLFVRVASPLGEGNPQDRVFHHQCHKRKPLAFRYMLHRLWRLPLGEEKDLGLGNQDS